MRRQFKITSRLVKLRLLHIKVPATCVARMLVKISLLLVVLATAGHCKLKSNDEKTLSWPDKYHVEVTKYLTQAGLTEDVKIWKTAKESRIEYNNGAVKSFVTKGRRKRDSGFTYEIHPETYGLDEDELNVMKCLKTKRRRWISGPEDILPDPEDFEYAGEEERGSLLCSKFVKETKLDENNIFKETVWASYNKEGKWFAPSRYEIETINTWTANLDDHDIWEFENFETDFDEKEYLDATKYCPKGTEVTDPDHDEAVTKHLTFVNPDNKHHVDHVFKAYKKKFNKNYPKHEHSMRRNIFQKNLRMIKITNRKNLGYKLAVNKFSDRTPEEMKLHMGLMRRPEGRKGLEFPYDDLENNSSYPLETLPKEYDLRLQGIISPVQNQEDCGSCWTFGTTSAIEGAIARKNGGNLIRLSNQALIDCAWEFGVSGCQGGFDTAVYDWAKKYGMPKLSDYGQYESSEGYCHIDNVNTTYKIKDYVDVPPNSILSLKVALIENGPLSVSVHVSDAFKLYNSGVFYDLNCENRPEELNHEVTLIGYGEHNGETFWILKNSWGQEWGLDGFMHILAKDNNCGVMTEPTYVKVTLIGYGEHNGETFWILKNSWGQEWGLDGFMHILAKDNNCGVMTEPTYELNHEVTLIGYGEHNGETFWILKNSWGQEWGLDGFMHILAKDNNCGVMTEPTYVKMLENLRNHNHEVTLIGYGEQNGETFWILKNSWGQEWGLDGFMHSLAKDNNCGVMTEPTYVKVKLIGYGEHNGETFWILKNSWGQEWGLDGFMHILAKENNCGVMTEPTYVKV
ncbi:papain family cysteine protease domain-containing protein [Phthorimaea operculella]|nr:papain family cysteine protease domain-containing protein [Phthorimaea operculella]